MSNLPLSSQLINLLAAVLLLLAFAMLAQRRVLTLINLFAAQGFALACSTGIVAYVTHQPHLYGSATLTLLLKVFVLPWLLHRLINQLDVRWEFESLINVPTTMIMGIVLVVFAFNLALPISRHATLPLAPSHRRCPRTRSQGLVERHGYRDVPRGCCRARFTRRRRVALG